MAIDPATHGSLHPVAARGFAASPQRYESGRPGYPADAVSWMCERLGIQEGAVVVDVAAGTGKLTRLLAAGGARVIAVEPVAEMATLLQSLTPGVELVSATAEALPFVAASVDAITAGQAFHWFDAERAWAEFHRVLRPGGGVGLVWNVRDRSVVWIDQVWTIMDEVEKKAPWRNHDHPALVAGTGFAPLEKATFWQGVTVTHREMLDRIVSVSHIAVLPQQERNACGPGQGRCGAARRRVARRPLSRRCLRDAQGVADRRGTAAAAGPSRAALGSRGGPCRREARRGGRGHVRR